MPTIRSQHIADILEMLEQMSDEQLTNIREYVADELEEPNHEAVALEAIIQLSRKCKAANSSANQV